MAKRKKKIKKKKKKRRKKPSKKTKLVKKKSSKQAVDSEGNTVFKVSDSWAKQAYANKSQYEKKYKLSLKDNDGFWNKEGKRITWIKPYTKIKDVKYSKQEVNIKWYYDGTLNASANCIDRHLEKKGNKTAIIWVGDDPSDHKKITYRCRAFYYIWWLLS